MRQWDTHTHTHTHKVNQWLSVHWSCNCVMCLYVRSKPSCQHFQLMLVVINEFGVKISYIIVLFFGTIAVAGTFSVGQSGREKPTLSILYHTSRRWELCSFQCTHRWPLLHYVIQGTPEDTHILLHSTHFKYEHTNTSQTGNQEVNSTVAIGQCRSVPLGPDWFLLGVIMATIECPTCYRILSVLTD